MSTLQIPLKELDFGTFSLSAICAESLDVLVDPPVLL